MKTRARLILVGLVALIVPLIAFGPTLARVGLPGRGDPRPNVILIVADDMRFDSLFPMSTLEQLGQRGTTFSNFFVTTPLCCPSRATILTGLYARHHGVLANNPPEGGVEAFDDRSTLATWLHDAGVRTGLAGRYLNGYKSLEIPPGWDFWFAIWQAGEDYSNYFDYRVNDNGVRRYFGSRPEQYSTRTIADQALKFIAADTQQPFMLMVTTRAPHGPATADPEDRGTFKASDFPAPPSLNEEDVSDKPLHIKQLAPLSQDEIDDLEVFRRRQWDTLLAVDRLIGRLTAQLESDGRLARTWILFTSDNGYALGEHRIWERKSCLYEECVRVPLVVIPPPGVEVPRSSARLTANIDLAPTIAALMQATPDRPVDGQSLLPLLFETDPDWRDALVLEMPKNSGDSQYVAIRTDDRKYARHVSGEEELYDESGDPFELRNLAGDPTWEAERTRLAERLAQLLALPPR